MIKLYKLETLDIHGTGISDFPPSLAHLPNLENLMVSVELKQRLPKLPDQIEVFGFYPEDERVPMQNSEKVERGISRWHVEVRRCGPQYPGLIEQLERSGFPQANL